MTANDSPGKQRCLPGVIGGLGPDATVDFMQTVLKLTPAEHDQDHIRMLIDQNPKVPNRQQAILSTGASPLPDLQEMALGLERAGADFIVMPCNTAHAYAAEIREVLTVPFISIVEVAIDAVQLYEPSSVGVLETPACRASGLYELELAARGLSSIVSSAAHCEALMALAYDVKRGRRDTSMTERARQLAHELVEQGAQALISGCTEIPLLLSAADVDVPLVSSTGALAERTIALARGDMLLN